MFESARNSIVYFHAHNTHRTASHFFAHREINSRAAHQVLVKDPWPLLYHGEPIYRNGKVCGTIRSSSYGHTLGGAVGLAMIDAVEGGAKVRRWSC
jgi:glycine cleavage system aminomethyltransferase T